MSAPDQKRATQPFKVALDDLQSLAIPEHPDNDLNSGSLLAPSSLSLDNQQKNSTTISPSASLSRSVEFESGTVLDTIADGIDLTVKGLADKLKRLDQKLTSMLHGEEEVELPKPNLPLRKKIKRKKTIAGKEVEVEEYEEVALPRLEENR